MVFSGTPVAATVSVSAGILLLFSAGFRNTRSMIFCGINPDVKGKNFCKKVKKSLRYFKSVVSYN